MGNMDNYFETSSRVAMSRPGELCVVASATHITALRASPEITSLGPADLQELDPTEPVPEHVLARARILVIEVDPSQPESLGRVRSIRASHSELKIIAAIANSSVALVKTLVREGICDVAELPFAPEELAGQILEASSDDLDAIEDAPLAPLYVAVHSTGGSGCTSMLTHLAAALAAADEDGKGVCLADFDLQSGEVANYVGAAAPVTVAALLDAGDRLDDDLVSSALLETRYGFAVIAAPDAIMPLELVSAEQIEGVLAALRRRFGLVLVDLPADWTNWSLAIAASADRIFMVTDSSIAGLKQGRRRIDLLESVGIDRNAVRVVANRTERRFFRSVGTGEIARALRADVVASLGNEGTDLREAQDQGALIGDTVGRNAYIKTIEDLARRLLAGEL